MPSVSTTARMTAAARGRVSVTVPQSNNAVNNNRNNASLPRAGD